MTKEKQLSDFLNLNVFKDNEYLRMYIKLLNDNLKTKKQKHITERHHILPKQYFKYFKKEIDNSEENLVNLKYCDHVLAHCLLALSFNNEYLTSMSIDACIYIINSFDIYKTLEEFVKDYEQVKNVLKCNHFVSDQQKEKISNISSKSRWYNNGEKESFSLVRPDGWVEGRLKDTSGWKAQADKARQRNKKCNWYNNGIKCTFCEICPEGWVPGRIMTEKLLASQKTNSKKPKKNAKNHGPYIPKSKYRWYNNGIVEHQYLLDTQPEGWIPGRLNTTKEKISKNHKK